MHVSSSSIIPVSVNVAVISDDDSLHDPFESCCWDEFVPKVFFEVLQKLLKLEFIS